MIQKLATRRFREEENGKGMRDSMGKRCRRWNGGNGEKGGGAISKAAATKAHTVGHSARGERPPAPGPQGGAPTIRD